MEKSSCYDEFSLWRAKSLMLTMPHSRMCREIVATDLLSKPEYWLLTSFKSERVHPAKNRHFFPAIKETFSKRTCTRQSLKLKNNNKICISHVTLHKLYLFPESPLFNSVR